MPWPQATATAPHYPHRLFHGLNTGVKAIDTSLGIQTAFRHRLSELKSKVNVVSTMMLVGNRGPGGQCVRSNAAIWREKCDDGGSGHKGDRGPLPK